MWAKVSVVSLTMHSFIMTLQIVCHDHCLFLKGGGGGCCPLGWSDLALFSIFENIHISADQSGTFLETQFQKIDDFSCDCEASERRTRGKDFNLKKSIFYY